MYTLSSDVFYKRASDNKLILIELSNPSNVLIEIEGVSTHVLIGIDNGVTVEKIIENICEEYDVTKDQVTQDVHKFIDELVNRKILITNP